MKKFKILICLLLVTCLTITCTACNSNPPKASIDPNGDILTEKILYEEILKEDILKGEDLKEYVLGVIQKVEDTIPEDVVVEDIKVEIMLADDIEGTLDNYFITDAYEYDIDWGKLIGKFAIGTGVIIVTAVFSIATAGIPGVGIVFATSCKEAIKEGIIGAAIGGILGTITQAIKNGGKTDALTKYAIEGAVDGYMWGAMSGAVIGAFTGGVNYYHNPNKIYNANTLLGTKKGLDIVDNTNNVVGKITQNGWVVDNTGKAIGKLDDVGNIVSSAKSLIPTSKNILGSTSKLKYTVNTANQVLNKSGKVIGNINDAGQIYSNGLLIGMVDDSGKLIDGLSKTINTGIKLNLSGEIVNATRIINGVTNYLDDAGNVVAKVLNTTNSTGKNVTYITQAVSSNSVNVIGDMPAEGLFKVVGQLDDTNNLVGTWNKYFQVERSKGVKLAWQQEKALVESTGRGTRDWTVEEIAELLSKGKVAV